MCGERGRELGAAADVQLAIDPSEVRLDCLGTDEQRLGDLAVRAALRREFGDAQLGRRQPRRRSRPRALGFLASAGRESIAPIAAKASAAASNASRAAFLRLARRWASPAISVARARSKRSTPGASAAIVLSSAAIRVSRCRDPARSRSAPWRVRSRAPSTDEENAHAAARAARAPEPQY